MSKFKFLKNKKNQANINTTTDSHNEFSASELEKSDKSEPPESNEEVIDAVAPPDRFKFLQEKLTAEAAQGGNGQGASGGLSTSQPVAETHQDTLPRETEEPKKPSILPGALLI